MRRMHRRPDAEAQLARKSDGKESKLSYSGNLLVENRNGLIVAAEVFVANGRAERDAALVMLEQIPGRKPVTVGGDKGFDTRDFVAECRHLGVTPHVAQNLARRGGSAIDGRTTQHSSYALSQKKRKRIDVCPAGHGVRPKKLTNTRNQPAQQSQTMRIRKTTVLPINFSAAC